MSARNVDGLLEARPAVIVASWRCGGTFLTHCLSNHPDVFCVRGEAMHRLSPWRALTQTPEDLLALVFGQHHYAVAMCKLTYTQAFHDAVWPSVKRHKPRFIWLRRENLIRQAVSLILVKMHHKGQVPQPVHAVAETPLVPVMIEPQVVVDHARSLARADEQARAQLAPFEPFEVTYGHLVGGENGVADRMPTLTAKRLCRFLGVEYALMKCGLARVNPYPLRTLLANWPDVERCVRDSEFAPHLTEEAVLWP